MKKLLTLFIFLVLNTFDTQAQVTHTLDTFVTRYERQNKDLSKLILREGDLIYFLNILSNYKFFSSARIINAKKTASVDTIKLKVSYQEAQKSLNLYIDTMISFIRDYPTVPEDYINRCPLFKDAFLKVRKFIMAYNRDFTFYRNDNKMYTKKTLDKAYKIILQEYYAFDVTNNEYIRNKNDLKNRFESIRWEDWNHPENSPKK